MPWLAVPLIVDSLGGWRWSFDSVRAWPAGTVSAAGVPASVHGAVTSANGLVSPTPSAVSGPPGPDGRVTVTFMCTALMAVSIAACPLTAHLVTGFRAVRRPSGCWWC